MAKSLNHTMLSSLPSVTALSPSTLFLATRLVRPKKVVPKCRLATPISISQFFIALFVILFTIIMRIEMVSGVSSGYDNIDGAAGSGVDSNIGGGGVIDLERHLNLSKLDKETVLRLFQLNLTEQDTPTDQNKIMELSAAGLNGHLVILSYSLIVLVSLVGNLLVCKVVFGVRSQQDGSAAALNGARKRYPRTTTDLLIGSLACSDLVMTVFNIPFNIARLLLPHWPFGRFLCFGVPFVQTACVYVSTFTMTAIAVHRWQTVSAHIKPSRLCSNRLLIGGVWLLASLLALPTVSFNTLLKVIVNGQLVTRCRVQYPVNFNMSLFLTVEIFLTQYLIPLLITCALYVKIAVIVSRQGRLVVTSASTGICPAASMISDNHIQRRRRTIETKRRRIIMLALVVLVFAICWLPLNLYHLTVDLNLGSHHLTVFLMCHWLAMSSVCYNSLIYCWLNAKFRRTASELLDSIMRCFKYKCWCTKSATLSGGDQLTGDSKVNGAKGANQGVNHSRHRRLTNENTSMKNGIGRSGFGTTSFNNPTSQAPKGGGGAIYNETTSPIATRLPHSHPVITVEDIAIDNQNHEQSGINSSHSLSRPQNVELNTTSTTVTETGTGTGPSKTIHQEHSVAFRHPMIAERRRGSSSSSFSSGGIGSVNCGGSGGVDYDFDEEEEEEEEEIGTSNENIVDEEDLIPLAIIGNNHSDNRENSIGA